MGERAVTTCGIDDDGPFIRCQAREQMEEQLMTSCSRVGLIVTYSFHAIVESPKPVTGLFTAEDNELALSNCATSNKHLDDNRHLDGRAQKRGKERHI